MRRQTLRSLQRHTIWLSLLGHLLFLISFSVALVLAQRDMPPASSPPASVPSYLSPSPEAPPAPQPAPEQKAEQPQQQQQAEPQQKPKEVDKLGIEKPVPKKPEEAKAKPKPAAKPKTTYDPRTVSFSRTAVPEDITNPRDREPLRLVGESKIIKPLIKILARALSQHLTYPRVAADFNLRGIVLVGFVLNPEGYVTEARVVQSSGAGVLDDAARDAVGAMSPVGDVREYVPEPQFLVVGIIFG